MDITKYQPVITETLKKLGVPKSQREDLTQECYVALLKKQEQLEFGEKNGEDLTQASVICWGAIQDTRKVNSHDTVRKKSQTDSLSDPRTKHKAETITDLFSVGDLDRSLMLEEALLSLPPDEYKVVYGVFFQGWTLDKAAEITGLTRDQVWRRKQQGIQKLREYFKEA